MRKDFEVGQTWREHGPGLKFAREIVALDYRNSAGMYPSVEWRRPGSMASRWCAVHRFKKWVEDTKATLV